MRAEIADMRAQMLKQKKLQSALEAQLEALTKREASLVAEGSAESKTAELSTQITKLEAEVEVLQTQAKVAQQAQADAAQRVAEYTGKYPVAR